MKLGTITVAGRERGRTLISQLSWISRSERHRETNSEASRKTWRATSIVYFLFFILCARSLAADPKTMAFLEEHTVAPGTPQTVGALYVVPPGRKAYVSNMVCEIRVVQRSWLLVHVSRGFRQCNNSGTGDKYSGNESASLRQFRLHHYQNIKSRIYAFTWQLHLRSVRQFRE